MLKMFLVIFLVGFSSIIYAKEKIDHCENPSTALDFNNCDMQIFEEEEKRLNSVYSKMLSLSKAYFREGVAKKLEVAQEKWVEYRKANCKFEYFTAYPGSAASSLSIICKRKMTKERMGYLQKMYDYYSSK